MVTLSVLAEMGLEDVVAAYRAHHPAAAGV